MFYNTQDMLWRRKLEEQADLQQAIELQNRRLMGLQLLDVKRNSHHRTLSSGALISSPTTFSPTYFNQNVVRSNPSSPEAKEGLNFHISRFVLVYYYVLSGFLIHHVVIAESGTIGTAANPAYAAASDHEGHPTINAISKDKDEKSNGNSPPKESDLQERYYLGPNFYLFVCK